MLETLKMLVEVHSGHPFRGSVPISETGNARVIQLRDISQGGDVNWDELSRTDIADGRSDWLRDGDILFAARGSRNYAVCLSAVPNSTVCAQYFFILRCKSNAVLPEFLAWLINRAPAQRYFLSNAEGSDQLSIRRGVLENMPVAVPSLQRQAQIVELAKAAAEHRRCLEALIRNTEQQLDALATQLLVDPVNKG